MAVDDGAWRQTTAAPVAHGGGGGGGGDGGGVDRQCNRAMTAQADTGSDRLGGGINFAERRVVAMKKRR
jgi:hypothetical protein